MSKSFKKRKKKCQNGRENKRLFRLQKIVI